MKTKTRGALLSIAVALLLATVVTWYGLSTRAMPDTRNSPAFDTLNEAPLWTRRYLRSTEVMTTTDDGNGEERVLLRVPLPTKDSGEVKVSEEISKNKKSYSYSAIKKWWASAMNFILRKDNEVKRLVKNVNNADASAVISILEEKHLQRWFNMGRSAEDIHGLLGLPKGSDLLKSPLVWIWLDYASWIGTKGSRTRMETIASFKKLFGNELEVAKMFAAKPISPDFKGHENLMILKRDWQNSLQPQTREQLKRDLKDAGVDDNVLGKFKKKHNQYVSSVEAP